MGQQVESVVYQDDERMPTVPNHELAMHGFHVSRSLSAADPPPYHEVLAEAEKDNGVHEMA